MALGSREPFYLETDFSKVHVSEIGNLPDEGPVFAGEPKCDVVFIIGLIARHSD